MAVFKFRNLNTGQAMPIPDGEFTVGREDDCYVHVEDASVSRHHAKLYNQEDGFFLEDLGSVNGTVARNTFITGRVKIEIGDAINLGSVPFRIDPEVAGEIHAPPPEPVPMKHTRKFRHPTERIPAPGEKQRVVEAIAPERLSAPAVNPNDPDAEALNAITMREPEAMEPMRLPTVRPGLTPLPQGSPALPVPTPPASNLTPPRPHAPQGAITPAQQPQLPAQKSPTAQSEVVEPKPEAPAGPTRGLNWGWLVLIFLAGMGTGLLLGLYFAKLFIELGGKAGSLP